MTAFESEVQKFVALQNGGEMTPRTVYGMLVAVDADARKRSAALETRLDAHLTDSDRLAPHRSGEVADYRAMRSPPSKPQKWTRESLVANFWVLVGLLVLSGVVNALLDLVFKR